MTAEIADGVFRIESVLGSRRLAQWLLVGDEGALLLDTGVAGTVGETILPAMAELGVAPERVVEVVLSHADVDHYGGDAEARAAFPAARLRAHPLDRPLIESWPLIAAERYGWYRRHGLDYPAPVWEWLERAAGPDTELDGELAAGERIELGGLAVEVVHLPGHSRGHVGLIEPASGTALIADAAMGAGFLDLDGNLAGPPPYLDLAAYRETIARLRELAPPRLETSHFAPLAGTDVDRFLARSADLVDRLEAALAAELDAGARPLAELLAPVAAAVGPYAEMEVELARSIGAHLEAVGAPG